ncbi:MAG: hypothetical protein Q9159_003752 [Coniocarpon cinnabarinum]
MSEAADLNKRILRRLTRALDADSEANIQDIIPSNYAARLNRATKCKSKGSPSPPSQCSVIKVNGDSVESHTEQKTNDNAFNVFPALTEPTAVKHDLSDATRTLLGTDFATMSSSGHELTRALVKVVSRSETIYPSASEQATYKRRILRCSENLIMKIYPSSHDLTEYTTLQYLERHKPDFPAPRPHGVLMSEKLAFIFISLVPGTTVASTWSTLQPSEKVSIRDQLENMFLSLRQMELPPGMPFGGVAGEGCKDTRLHTKLSRRPIYTNADFWEFQYADVTWSGQAYINFLRQLTKPLTAS